MSARPKPVTGGGGGEYQRPDEKRADGWYERCSPEFAHRVQLGLGTLQAPSVRTIQAVLDQADSIRRGDEFDRQRAERIAQAGGPPERWDDKVRCDGCGFLTGDPATCPHGFEWCPECRENGDRCNRCRADDQYESRLGI